MQALSSSACQPVMPQETTAVPAGAVPVPHTPREDAPPYGLRGPYAVGVRDFVIEGKEGARSITVSVWYPALNPEGLPGAVTYMLAFNNPDFPDFPVAGRALRDADPDPSGGPYPLMVYSHGYWLFRQVSAYLVEQLASWGFVVIAGDHEDNWGSLFGESESDNYILRPQEITRKIDYAMTLGADDAAFAGLIDPERIAVTGHSFGADTAFLNGCAAMPAIPEQGLGWVCIDAVWDMTRAHDLINHFVTAFLLAELRVTPTRPRPSRRRTSATQASSMKQQPMASSR